MVEVKIGRDVVKLELGRFDDGWKWVVNKERNKRFLPLSSPPKSPEGAN